MCKLCMSIGLDFIVLEAKCISQLRYLQKDQELTEHLNIQLARLKEVFAKNKELKMETASLEKRYCYVLWPSIKLRFN